MPSTAAEASEASGRIVELYPNPVRDGDVGEFVVVEIEGRENWTLSDGESTVAVPSPGRVALASEPRILTAPGNAEDAVVAELDAAEESIDVLPIVVLPIVGGPRQPFVWATVRAAEKGVRVRLLLSGLWYAEEENRAVADRLNEWADRHDAPLSVRLADPRGRYGKVHAKASSSTARRRSSAVSTGTITPPGRTEK